MIETLGDFVENVPRTEQTELIFGESPANERVSWSIDQDGHVITTDGDESFGYLDHDDEADAESRDIVDDQETMTLLREAEEDVLHGRTVDGEDLRLEP